MRTVALVVVAGCAGEVPLACDASTGTVSCWTRPSVEVLVVAGTEATGGTGAGAEVRTLLAPTPPFAMPECLADAAPPGLERRLTASFSALVHGEPPFTVEADLPIGEFVSCGEIALVE